MDLQQFILKHIESVDHLRALLLLRSDTKQPLTAMDVSARLYLEPKRAAAVLSTLAAAGVAQEQDGQYRYEPASKELGRMVDELERLDRERPVTLIMLIYSRPDTLEAFADAFKLRREE